MKKLRKYENLKRVNKYLLDEKSKSMTLINSFTKSRAEGIDLDNDKSFFFSRDPLYSICALKSLYMRYRIAFRLFRYT